MRGNQNTARETRCRLALGTKKTPTLPSPKTLRVDKSALDDLDAAMAGRLTLNSL